MITKENKLIRTNNWSTIKCSTGMCNGELEYVSVNDLNPDLNIALCPKCNRLFRLTDKHNVEELIKHHPDYLTKAEKVRLLLK
jgi:uncharacterized protein with PIN domain